MHRWSAVTWPQPWRHRGGSAEAKEQASAERLCRSRWKCVGCRQGFEEDGCAGVATGEVFSRHPEGPHEAQLLPSPTPPHLPSSLPPFLPFSPFPTESEHQPTFAIFYVHPTSETMRCIPYYANRAHHSCTAIQLDFPSRSPPSLTMGAAKCGLSALWYTIMVPMLLTRKPAH